MMTPVKHKNDTKSKTQSAVIIRAALVCFAQIYLALAVPVLLTLIGARLAMTTIFLRFEYNRPDFPEDAYGFTQEDRLHYASLTLNYLLNDESIDFLERLTFSDGSPLFTQRELTHMEDVKAVTHGAFGTLIWGGFSTCGVAALLWYKSMSRYTLRLALIAGLSLTLVVIGAIVMITVAAWDVFFTSFHQLLFESGTWRFYYSDTLIRLFPERFWFDAALLTGGFASTVAFVMLLLAWRWTIPAQ